MASHRAAPRRAESCARSALGLGYDSKFSLPCGVLMAGYAAGFSGLESFSPSLSIYLPRSIFPFTRAVLFSNARKSRKGNREREERSPHRKIQRKKRKERRRQREKERETSCSRFFGTGNARPRRDLFNIVCNLFGRAYKRNEASVTRQSRHEQSHDHDLPPRRFTRLRFLTVRDVNCSHVSVK